MKIKLRDMTEEQYKKWRNFSQCFNRSCESCPFNYINCLTTVNSTWVNHKDLYTDKFLDQEIEIDDPILTKEEKEYLENVIKPFKSSVVSIRKERCFSGERIIITVSDSNYTQFDSIYETINLLPFTEDTMYKGIQLRTDYTLEELGLFKNDK